MFFLLRAALVIGLIFYFSPVRREGGSAARSLHDAAARSREASRATFDAFGQAGELQSLWQALPDEAKKAALDRLLAPAPGHSSGEPAQTQAPAQPQAPSMDTLLPDDLRPAWRGGRAAGAGRQP